jgi:hypothetical protein
MVEVIDTPWIDGAKQRIHNEVATHIKSNDPTILDLPEREMERRYSEIWGSLYQAVGGNWQLIARGHWVSFPDKFENWNL